MLGGEFVTGFNEDFSYDPIGNRVSSTDYDETGAARTSTYTANNLKSLGSGPAGEKNENSMRNIIGRETTGTTGENNMS